MYETDSYPCPISKELMEAVECHGWTQAKFRVGNKVPDRSTYIFKATQTPLQCIVGYAKGSLSTKKIRSIC